MLDFSAESWRDSNDYRRVFFKRNKPFLGAIWFCSQCGLPMLGSKDVQVDHIFPGSKGISKRAKEKGKKNSILATFLNTEINTAAICGPCNQSKGAKVSVSYLVRGFSVKFFHKITGTIQDSFILVAYVLLLLIHSVLKGVIKLLSVFGGGKKKKSRSKSRGLGKSLKALVMPAILVALVIAIIYISRGL